MNTMVVELAGFDTKGVYRRAGEIVAISNPAADVNSIVLPGFDASGRETRKRKEAR